jgi:pyruvate dehydrogenase E1 component beta subunit
MFIDFTLVCMDQIINQVAKVRYMLGGQVEVPLVIRTQGGGGKGYAAQHSQSLEVLFSHIPGLKVVMPSNPGDAKGLLKSAIRDNNPVLFIEHKLLYNEKGEVPEGDYNIPIGEAKICREGKDITMVAHSRMVLLALKAAEILEKEGISCEVIDLRTLRPLDIETITKSIRKTHRLITVEEGHLSFGLGAEIAARVTELAFDELDAPPVRIGAMEAPIPFNERLEKEVLPSPEKIINAVRQLIS